MNFASCILTYRENDSPDRRANLQAVLAWLATMPELEIVLVEQDSVPRLTDLVVPAHCRRAFAYNPGPFNKSWGYNVGYRFARANVLIFADADILLPDSLAPSVEACTREFQVVKPYRRIVDLTREETLPLRAGAAALAPARAAQVGQNREGVQEFVVLCGGIVCMRRDGFNQLGGWDERFLGWGGEDDALTYKLQRLRLSTVELDEHPAVHLWHPRSHASTLGQPRYADNCAILADDRSRSDDQLQRFAEVQLQVIGNTEKYRPAR